MQADFLIKSVVYSCSPLTHTLRHTGFLQHIFYALKMGKKYRARYQRHFAHPVLHEQNLQHEELLACRPEQWAQLVKSIALLTVNGRESLTV